MGTLYTTIVSVSIIFLFIFVIIIERRTRNVVHNRHYMTHTIIPGTKLIIESKRHPIFQIPEEIGNGEGWLYFHCTGELRQYSNVSCTLHGISDEVCKVFDFNHNDRFVVNKCVPFQLRDMNRQLSIKIDTYNPCSQNIMSDLMITLVLDTYID